MRKVVLYILFLSVAIAFCAEYSRTPYSSYLMAPVSARDEALGQAFLLLWTNPSAVDDNNNLNIGLGYRNRWGDASDNFVSLTYEKNKICVFSMCNISTISELEGRKFATAEPDYLFDANRANILLGTAYRIRKDLWVGLAVRHIHERMDFESFDANTMSGGIKYFWRNLTLGISATDYGAEDSFVEYLYPAPTMYRAQGEYKWRWLSFGAAYIKPDMRNGYGSAGIEATILDKFIGRGSYTIGLDTRNAAFGAGFRWKGFLLEYALSLYSELGMNHFISLNYNIPLEEKKTDTSE